MKKNRFLIIYLLVKSILIFGLEENLDVIEPEIENMAYVCCESTEEIQTRASKEITRGFDNNDQLPVYYTRLFPQRKLMPQDPSSPNADFITIEDSDSDSQESESEFIEESEIEEYIEESEQEESFDLDDSTLQVEDYFKSEDSAITSGQLLQDENRLVQEKSEGTADDSCINFSGENFEDCELDDCDLDVDNHDVDISEDGQITRACICPARHASPNFIGATLSDTLSFPPDSMGAVGLNQYIVAVNGRVISFNKKTGKPDGVLNVSTNQFFEKVRAGGRTTDPRIRFDFHTKRWFLVMINIGTPNRILIAVSNTANITKSSIWRFFTINMQSNEFADFPTLGIDRNALYIGVNTFAGLTGGFIYSAAFVVPKSSVLSIGPIRAFGFRNLSGANGMLTPQGVDNFDRTSRGFFIGTSSSYWGRLVIREVINPSTTPKLGPAIQLTVPTTAYPIPVPHKGNLLGPRGYLDSVDDRLTSSHIRRGFLYTAHNIGVNNKGVSSGILTRNGSRWYKINVKTAGQAKLAKTGTLYKRTLLNVNTATHFWMPSVMTNGRGDMSLGCSFSGALEYIKPAFRIRFATNSGSGFNRAHTLANSLAVYAPSFDRGTPRRWGDYSHTSLDPSDNMSMWTIQQYCQSNNSYAVRVARILAPPPATPIKAVPSSVPRQNSSINVTITGRSGASAFYDPGSGFQCRLKARVSGGVRVNSLRYVNRKTVVLNITTSKATRGLKTVTIINPDCQKRSNAILRVI